MKRINLFFLLFVGLLMAVQVQAQEKPSSPPAKANGKIGKVDITINYHAPSVRGRKVFGELVPYGKVWRTGANNATTFEIDQDVTIEGQKLAKGKYALFTIPGESEWTIIFNSKHDQWGNYSYKEEEDVLRVKVKAGKTKAFVENLTISVDKDKVNIEWENTSASFKVKG
jgi:hypothetical protein